MRQWRIAFLLVLPFIFSACHTEKDVPQIVQPPAPAPSFTYLALGDSYTIGESVAYAERYPVQLVNTLRAAGASINDPRIIARTGWTTDELNQGINNASDLQPPYDLVSLLIGVNNQFRGRPVSDYRPEFKTLLDRAVALAGGRKDRVFVVSIPDYAYTPYGNGSPAISAGIDAYNAANEEITRLAGIRYFNITPISREGLQDSELVAPDRLHPSGKQYGRWVALMKDPVRAMLPQ